MEAEVGAETGVDGGVLDVLSLAGFFASEAAELEAGSDAESEELELLLDA
ncbi:MAG TPA: hypothetical protein VMA34_09195 [Terracidiphilus sp.]|nr:hypothetical protein [Terracidiphilus sp.]